MPATTKELWQWFRTQPVLDLQRTYLDVATAGPTLRAAMATEYRVRDSQSLNLALVRRGAVGRREHADGHHIRRLRRL